MSNKKNRRQVSRPAGNLAPRVTEFNPDYTIIKRDIKRIGILAGTFFAILIVLAIFQNQLLGVFLK